MTEEIIVYRFGDVQVEDKKIIKSKEVMKAHFEHLRENGTLLFTTSSRISTKDKNGQQVIFTDEDKTHSFQATIIDCGKFGIRSPEMTDFKVPREFENILEAEVSKGFTWFAVRASEDTLTYEEFGKGLYRLARTDVYDSLGENQTPFRYAVPINKQ